MVADPKSHKYRFLFLITILMIVFLLVGLYFGIRIGAGYYDFYRPDSPYYQNAVSQMSHDSYNNGWDDGFDDGYAQNQEASYNKGYRRDTKLAGWKTKVFAMNMMLAIR